MLCASPTSTRTSSLWNLKKNMMTMTFILAEYIYISNRIRCSHQFLLIQSPLFLVCNGHCRDGGCSASIGQKIMGAGGAEHWKIPQCCALKKN